MAITHMKRCVTPLIAWRYKINVMVVKKMTYLHVCVGVGYAVERPQKGEQPLGRPEGKS